MTAQGGSERPRSESDRRGVAAVELLRLKREHNQQPDRAKVYHEAQRQLEAELGVSAAELEGLSVDEDWLPDGIEDYEP